MRTERVVPEEEELENLPKPPRIPEAVVLETVERLENHSTKTQSKKREIIDEESSNIVSGESNIRENQPRSEIESQENVS